MGSGFGYGKTILFGEHFVVYGLPAVASAIGHKTMALIEDAGGFVFVDERPETPGYKERKAEEIGRQLDYLRKRFNLNDVKVTLSGDLVCASGVGASAALAASISRAASDHFKLGLGDEQINEAAYEAEKAGSGKASGIDNTCSVYGGFIVFTKNLGGGPDKIERVSVRDPMRIVMASSGITQTTKEVVDDVRRLKNENPKQYERLFAEYKKILDEGLKALEVLDLPVLGELMNSNQELLAEMTLSCPEIEEIREAALAAGALGSKLTGTGRGGTVISLAPSDEVQDAVSQAIEDAGYSTLKSRIGV